MSLLANYIKTERITLKNCIKCCSAVKIRQFHSFNYQNQPINGRIIANCSLIASTSKFNSNYNRTLNNNIFALQRRFESSSKVPISSVDEVYNNLN